MPLVSKTFSQIVTFTRASSATYFDSAGVLQSATTDVPRFDYNPSTLAALGFLIEESRTNGIRNNTMQGAVAGTPGTLPTNWGLGGISGGLATQIVGTGTESGIAYIDIRIFGTNSSGSSVFPGVFFDTTTGIAGTTGQVWSSSVYLSLAAGTGINFELSVHENDSGGAFLRSTLVSGAGGVPTTGSLATRRRAGSVTLGASTAFVRPVIAATVTNGQSVDFTIRIGLPQLELGAFATSVIPTTTTALTRAADVALVNTLSPWYNAAEYTLYYEGMVQANNDGIVYTGIGDTFDNTAYFTRVAPNQAWAVRSGASAAATINISFTPTAGVPFKMAATIKTDDFAFCVNGGSVATDTSGAAPVSAVRLGIGNAPWTASGGNGRQQWIRRITYYPRKLSSAELQTLTT